jgi:divinyl chlorophyllide a 8-vinyl-reductase
MAVFVTGATGTIGRAVVAELVSRGHPVTCLTRRDVEIPGAEVVVGDVGDPGSLAQMFGATAFDAVISCLASRTGAPEDAWAIDHRAQLNILAAARAGSVGHFVLLSAICVQKPVLAFQQAKRAFEEALAASGLRYSIVRPTAFFKSLSGQVGRVRSGKPFLVFGDGRLTACKPISDRDLADFIVGCLELPERWDRILPIGGPGPALTPLDQGRALAVAFGVEPRFRHVPVALLSTIIAGLSAVGTVSPRLRAKAELARIGRYYGTESMLVHDPATGRYDAAATPEHGSDTLPAFYARLAAGEEAPDLGDHAVF